MEQIIPHKSLRFFPHWNTYESNQVVGFLNLILYILERKTIIKNWVELGSFTGESANMVLGFPQIKHLDCIDLSVDLLNQTNIRLKRFILNQRCSTHNISSKDFLAQIPENYMDVVYIDANHEYDFVKSDIELSFHKLKKNGFLSGHDYNIEYKCFPGVIQAVDEFSQKNGLEIIKFIDNSWLMHKV